MKVVVNTNYNAAGTIVLEGLVKRLFGFGFEITKNDWGGYGNYDVAIFMAPDSAVFEAKASNKNIKCIIFDPKVSTKKQRKDAKLADLLLVSSVEQKDFFLKYNKNILIYYMFPDVSFMSKEHVKKDKIIIGYHGNKQHLDAMKNLSWALDKISKKYDIEFLAIYNIKKLGRWIKNIPRRCKVRHIQWTPEFIDELKEVDIGVAPSLLTAPKFFARPLLNFLYNPESYNKNDYLLRFKMSNNPGRIYVFSQLLIPVVSEFTPSACEIIKDGFSGILVGTKYGWLNALENLIKSHEARNFLASNLKEEIEKNFSIEDNFKTFLSYINKWK